MSIQEETKKKNYKRYKISFKDLVFNVKVQNAGKKPNCLNMIWFLIKSSWLLVVIFIFITTGTLNTLLYKLQNECTGKVGSEPPKAYAHPWTQNFFMFVGMTCACLIPHWIKEFIVEPMIHLVCLGLIRLKLAKPKPKVVLKPGEVEKKPLPKINQLLFTLPGLCDSVASTILSLALIFTYASVYQMLQCVTVVFTFLLSVVLLKHNFHKFPHKWIGVTLVLIGSALVGLNTIVYPQGSGYATARAPFFGACCVLLSCFIYALFYIFEEWFLTGYDTDPLQVPGYEGFWGVIIVIFVLFVIYWIPGPDYGSWENFPASVVQTVQNDALLTWVIILTVNIGFYNMMGNVITLNISCATRAVLDQIRAALIWVIQMARGRQEFTWLQLVGFLILLVGVSIYNEFLFNIFIPWYLKWAEKINKMDEETGHGSFWWCFCDCYQCWKGCLIGKTEEKQKTKSGEVTGDEESGEEDKMFQKGKVVDDMKDEESDDDQTRTVEDFDRLGFGSVDEQPVEND